MIGTVPLAGVEVDAVETDADQSADRRTRGTVPSTGGDPSKPPACRIGSTPQLCDRADCGGTQPRPRSIDPFGATISVRFQRSNQVSQTTRECDPHFERTSLYGFRCLRNSKVSLV